jgi:hypothetical protein
MSDQPKEDNKPQEMNCKTTAFDEAGHMNYNNSSPSQRATFAALMYIGEQLVEHNNLLNMIVVDLDNLTRTWGKAE